MGACGGTCGITKERELEQQAALLAAARAYPGWTWRASPATPPLPLPFDAIAALGTKLEGLLPVRAIPRAAEGAGCDWLYLLAGIHTPCLLEVMDGVAIPGKPRARETYVRIGFSPLGPYVTLQEVRMTAKVDRGSIAVVEEPLVGVDDRRLQLIIKGLQGALRKAKLVVLDMAFLAEAPPVAAPQDEYRRAYGAAPTRWSYLFDAAPPSTTRGITAVAVARRTADAYPRGSWPRSLRSQPRRPA